MTQRRGMQVAFGYVTRYVRFVRVEKETEDLKNLSISSRARCLKLAVQKISHSFKNIGQLRNNGSITDHSTPYSPCWAKIVLSIHIRGDRISHVMIPQTLVLRYFKFRYFTDAACLDLAQCWFHTCTLRNSLE
ncbi:hypothetical protein TNCV_2348161 [Trichonephila clavipes]|uniref:Uncharacterized protein n=1 Tax=Trichonephila clavipes TaxID=2585209 RepID=A0A8X6SPZ9_TRICX|nr:hypothetical protein TNCV_2348161 [Trichonephila clavipes]